MNDLIDQETLRKRVQDWVFSPEGAKSLLDTANRIKAANEAMGDARMTDPEIMRKPMTI